MKHIIGHLDMDCFFCACEEKKNITLKGNPVIVGSTTERGVVSTSNYEARKFGVFSATPISIAKKKCPQGIFLGVDMKLYKKESINVMNVLYTITKNVEQVSVDEAYMELTEYSKKFKSLYIMAKTIQNKVLKETGLTCSIGISKSRVVSKIASDYKKPSGITIVEDDKEFLKDMSISKIPGIGKVSKSNYIKHNIIKIGDIVHYDKFELIDKFGKQAIKYQNIASGLDFSGLFSHKVAKSISKETTFLEDVGDMDRLIDEIEYLSINVHNQLKKFTYKTISVKIRYSNFETITRDYSITLPNSRIDIIKSVSKRLFLENYDDQRKIRLIGVKLTNLNFQELNQMKLTDFF